MSEMPIFKTETEVPNVTTAKATTRTRKTAATATPTTPTTPDTVATVAPTVAVNRADIVARIKGYATDIRGYSEMLLADVLTLSAGILAKEYADTLGPEIGAQRVGRILTHEDKRALVKALRNVARDGGKVNGKDVAAVLGISTGQVSTLENESEDATDVGADGSANEPRGKSGVEILTRIEADLLKALAKEDAMTEEFQARLTMLLVTARKGLPSGIDTNNRGSKS